VPRHPELGDIARCFGALRADLEPHLLKEERVLFPLIRELVLATTMPSFHCGSLRNPISVMEREHDTAGALLAEVRELTGGYTCPPDGCTSYEMLYRGLAELESDTHLHVHKENNVLFPLVEQIERRLAP
jgi:regulator of cell morphogenesis and NO signaling